jgi:hypothetical protein
MTTNYAKYLNTDVELVANTNDGTQIENMVNLVNNVQLDKDVIKAYLTEWESCLVALGKTKEQLKPLKSARKAILDFAAGLRKEQLAKPELWGNGEAKRMIPEIAKESGYLNEFATKCRQACKDEEDAPIWNLEEKLGKLIEKALEEGYNAAEIKAAMTKAAKTVQDVLPEAA